MEKSKLIKTLTEAELKKISKNLKSEFYSCDLYIEDGMKLEEGLRKEAQKQKTETIANTILEHSEIDFRQDDSLSRLADEMEIIEE